MHNLYAVRPLVHPAAEDISLQGLLYALADPMRLSLFRRLAGDSFKPASCVKCAPSEMPKSSLSRHIRILREAGLLYSERRGTEVINLPRIEAVETRFPGLLSAILAAPATVSARPTQGSL